MPISRFTIRLPHPPAQVFAWHAAPGALPRLVPPWSGVRVVRPVEALVPGATAELRVPFGPLRFRWQAVHPRVEPPDGFADAQAAGPFRHWRHEHRFLPVEGGTSLVDEIDWQPPRGPASWWAASPTTWHAPSPGATSAPGGTSPGSHHSRAPVPP